MNITKAEQVYEVYCTAANTHSEGCYSLAIAAAIDLGGVEVYNSNDVEGSKRFAPTRAFEFDDGTGVTICYSQCFYG